MNSFNRLSLNPKKIPFFYGYVIVIAGILGVLASIPGQTIGVSSFTNPVLKALGLSRDQFSFAYMLGTFASSFLLTMAGKWYDRYGVRYVALFAVLVMSLSLFLLSKSDLISLKLGSFLNLVNWIAPFTVIAILFFILRYSGQGILTLVSKNMVMKWFETKRGRVNAIISVFISLGFSISPLWISGLIDQYQWQGAWLLMAIGALIFAIVVIVLFHDNPEEFDLKPDGKAHVLTKKVYVVARIEFTLKEAISTRAFWTYSLMLAFNASFITGFTFHIQSIFENAGFDKAKALSVFVPGALVSVAVSLISNYMSDAIKLKRLLYLMIFGSMVFVFGVITLKFNIGYYLIILGSGIMGGLFSVLSTIAWPRFFGRKYLGAVSGKSMSMIVIGSAIGPGLFSLSNTYLGGYDAIAYLSLIYLFVVLLSAKKANNPQ